MARKLVEGQTLGIASGEFADTTAVTTLPTPADGVVYRDDQAGGDLILTVPGIIRNADSINHNFRYLLRGSDVPGGELLVTPILSPGNALAPIDSGEAAGAAVAFPLIGDQRIDVEMQEAIGAGPAPNFTQSFLDSYSPLDKLTVRAVVPRTEVATFNDGQDYVLSGSDEFSARQVLFTQSFKSASHIVNIDDDPHTMQLVFSTDGGSTEIVIAEVEVPMNTTFAQAMAAAGIVFVETLNLLDANARLTVRTTTPTTTTDPYVLMQFSDFI